MPGRIKTYEAVLALLLGVLLLVRLQGHPAWWWVALALILLALIAYPLAQRLAWAWLKLAELLGAVVSRILLTLVHLLVLTPMALMQRMMGKNPLQLKNPGPSTYLERRHRFTASDLDKPW